MNKNNKEENRKLKKIFRIVAIISISIVTIELLYITIANYIFEKKNTFYDLYNHINADEDNYIIAGSSQFRFSKYNSWENGYQKAKLTKTNAKGKIIFEKTFTSPYNSLYNSAIRINDGYIAVGSYEKTKEQIELKTTTALIVKYDDDGKFLWNKDYQVLGDSVYNDIIEVEDGYIAIGQSIYENMEIGNHDTGGGIIVKYSKEGEIIWYNNYGGNKSGNFNDIVETNDGYYVVGKDSVNTGILVKYDKDGKYVFSKNYKYTDKIGFTGLELISNNLIVVGAKEINENVYDAVIVKYDLTGNIVGEYLLEGTSNERYNKVSIIDNNIIVVGTTSSQDITKTFIDDKQALIVKYDINGNKDFLKTFGKSNEESYNDVLCNANSCVAIGYSNSYFGIFSKIKSTKKDYFSRFIKYDLKGNTIIEK